MVKQFSFTLDLSYVLDNIWDNEYLCQNTSDWLRISSIEIYHSAFKLSKCQEIDWYLKFPWVFPRRFFLHRYLYTSRFFDDFRNVDATPFPVKFSWVEWIFRGNALKVEWKLEVSLFGWNFGRINKVHWIFKHSFLF